MGIGNNLKRLLAIKKMTIKELAEKTGIPVNTLYSITQRDSRSTQVAYLNLIAQALEIDIDQLVNVDVVDVLYTKKVLSDSGALIDDFAGKTPTPEDAAAIFDVLNLEGREKAIDYMADLAEQAKYRKDSADQA